MNQVLDELTFLPDDGTHHRHTKSLARLTITSEGITVNGF